MNSCNMHNHKIILPLELSSNYKTAVYIMYCTVGSSSAVPLTVEELRMRLRVHKDHTEGNLNLLQRLADRSSLDVKAANKVSLEYTDTCRNNI
jgi:hypothetical protein